MDIFVGGAWKVPSRGEVLVSGAWRRLTRGEVYRDGAWRPIFTFVSPLSVSAFDAEGGVSSYKPTRVTSNPTTATPVGGYAPYSYSWVTGAGNAVANSPATATTTFSAIVGVQQIEVSEATVTCTDALGSTATATITITLTNDGGI